MYICIRDPALQCCWPECTRDPVLTCGSCGISRYCSKDCQVLHWKSGHKIACKRKDRIDFVLFNIPEISQRLLLLDNEPNHGGVAEPLRRWMDTIDIMDSDILGKIYDSKHFLGDMLASKKVAQYLGYYLEREKFESYFWYDLANNEDCPLVPNFLLVNDLTADASFDLYREQVSLEMLLCNVMIHYKICQIHSDLNRRYEVVYQDFEKLESLVRLLPKDLFDIQVGIVGLVYLFYCDNNRVAQGIALGEELYISISEENGVVYPALQTIITDVAYMNIRWGTDINRATQWALVAIDNLCSFVKYDDPITFCDTGFKLAMYVMPDIIRLTKKKECKALYEETEQLIIALYKTIEQLLLTKTNMHKKRFRHIYIMKIHISRITCGKTSGFLCMNKLYLSKIVLKNFQF